MSAVDSVTLTQKPGLSASAHPKRIASGSPNTAEFIFDMTFSSTNKYPTGGYTFSHKLCREIVNLIPQSLTGTYIPVWLPGTSKIKLLDYAGSQVSNDTDVSAETIRCTVTAYR